MCQPWFWGENCIHSFIYVFTYSTSISVILEAQGTWRLLTVHLHILPPPPLSQVTQTWFCHIIPKMAFEKSSVASYQSSYSLSGCCVGFRTIFCLLELYALGSLFFWWPLAHSFNWIVFYIFTQEQQFYEEISLSPILLSLSTVSLPEGTHLFPPVSFSFTYHS